MLTDIRSAILDRRTVLFFDMDGVLAEYDRDAYDPSKGITPGRPLFEEESMRYFRTCRPDLSAIGLLRSAIRTGRSAYILTSVRSDLPWTRFDKIWWLRRHVPEFDASNRLIVASGDKAQMIMAREKLAGLSASMILLDDFNRNLEDWRRAGGTAIKYLNGINSPETWTGLKLDRSDMRLLTERT